MFLLLPIFSKIFQPSSLKIRASLEKMYIFGILVERAIYFVNFVQFERTWKFDHFLAHFFAIKHTIEQ